MSDKTDLELIRECIRDGHTQCACVLTVYYCNDKGAEDFITEGYRVITTDFPRALAALEEATEELLDIYCTGIVVSRERYENIQHSILAILRGGEEAKHSQPKCPTCGSVSTQGMECGGATRGYCQPCGRYFEQQEAERERLEDFHANVEDRYDPDVTASGEQQEPDDGRG